MSRCTIGYGLPGNVGQGGTAEQRFKSIVRYLDSEGVYPSPTPILRKLAGGRHNERLRPNSLSGRECEWRREVLIQLGWRIRPYLRSGTRRAFIPPTGWVELYR